MIRRLIIAIQFLTIIPLSSTHSFNEEDLGKSMLFFPLVGLFIGGILVCTRIPLSLCLPGGVVDALLIAVLIIITGAMHLDALADTADGIFSGKEKTVKLQIMKDSSVGAMGMVTLFTVLLLKYVTLIAVSVTLKNKALLLMPMMGRWAQVIVSYCSVYAGQSRGLGFPFTTHVHFPLLLLSAIFSVGVAFYLFSLTGVVIAGAIAVIAVLYSLFFKRLLGGVTGDVLGALTEIAEVIVLILILATC
jgi:adenosylcobinamide-GDP ribazoletransferase